MQALLHSFTSDVVHRRLRLRRLRPTATDGDRSLHQTIMSMQALERVNVAADASGDAGFVETAAAFLLGRMREALKTRGSCVVGLSGGSTPGPVYARVGEALDGKASQKYCVGHARSAPASSVF